MTGGQVAPTTPVGATATTAPYGCFERPFNLPFLAESSGAVYVARWTVFHVRYIAHSMMEAFQKKGFSFIEILSPCPTLYQRRNKMGDGLETMRFYRQHSIIKNGANTREVDISLQGDIIVGKFVDIERPTLQQSMEQQLRQTLKDRYAGWGGA
jgi:2-oxoglutarate ferredoxin oxidoreductase subunit beta